MDKVRLLTDKERIVLDAIVKNYILTATPVASNHISRLTHLAYSPATIRNIMVALEEKGYIYQPHTSAGRVPTTAGYRTFVDHMMRKNRLSKIEREKIRQAIMISAGDFENVFRESSRILAHLSHQLSIIIAPELEEGIFHRMDLNRLNSEKLLLIIAIKSGMVKSIVMEINSGVSDKQLITLRQILNERLHGLKLREIRTGFKEIIKDVPAENSAILHLFVEAADQIFNFSTNKGIFVTGTHNMLSQPEFINSGDMLRVVEVLEDRNVIVHLLDLGESSIDTNILIGDEIELNYLQNCSIITARYRIGQVQGTLGILGPKRMDYAHMIPLVECTAGLLSDSYEGNWY
jgi:heat-inducible transcriptional repressor